MRVTKYFNRDKLSFNQVVIVVSERDEVYLNSFVLLMSGMAGYYQASVTLKKISFKVHIYLIRFKMLSEQYKKKQNFAHF